MYSAVLESACENVRGIPFDRMRPAKVTRMLTQVGQRLFFPEEADAGCEGAAIVTAESQELGRVDVGVDDDWIRGAGDVVETTAQRPIVAKKMKALFQVQIQSEISREAIRPGRSVEQLLIVEDVEGESGARFGGIGEIQFVNDGKSEKGKKTPG